MNVWQWVVEQIEKDSECCGNPWACHREVMIGNTVFKRCAWDDVEEDVLEK